VIIRNEAEHLLVWSLEIFLYPTSILRFCSSLKCFSNARLLPVDKQFIHKKAKGILLFWSIANKILYKVLITWINHNHVDDRKSSVTGNFDAFCKSIHLIALSCDFQRRKEISFPEMVKSKKGMLRSENRAVHYWAYVRFDCEWFWGSHWLGIRFCTCQPVSRT